MFYSYFPQLLLLYLALLTRLLPYQCRSIYELSLIFRKKRSVHIHRTYPNIHQRFSLK